MKDLDINNFVDMHKYRIADPFKKAVEQLNNGGYIHTRCKCVKCRKGVN